MISRLKVKENEIPRERPKTVKLKMLQGHIWLSVFMDGSGKCKLQQTPSSTGRIQQWQRLELKKNIHRYVHTAYSAIINAIPSMLVKNKIILGVHVFKYMYINISLHFQDKFDYWQSLIKERVQMVMYSEISDSMCNQQLGTCVDRVVNNFKNCSMYLVRKSLILQPA